MAGRQTLNLAMQVRTLPPKPIYLEITIYCGYGLAILWARATSNT